MANQFFEQAQRMRDNGNNDASHFYALLAIAEELNTVAIYLASINNALRDRKEKSIELDYTREN